ncbi:MAG: hypothetical protein QT03_C0001G0526 [archaeon GW2011_AR10]|nr:MAG: hypothetical protein QT03_C0001G0526 [archaeon GW2011_AR10]
MQFFFKYTGILLYFPINAFNGLLIMGSEHERRFGPKKRGLLIPFVQKYRIDYSSKKAFFFEKLIFFGVTRKKRRGSMGFRDNRFGGPRQMFDAVCSDCGQDTQVPFKPTEGRPVYCRDCYAKHAPPRSRDRGNY